jgi:hypothetical protein
VIQYSSALLNLGFCFYFVPSLSRVSSTISLQKVLCSIVFSNHDAGNLRSHAGYETV